MERRNFLKTIGAVLVSEVVLANCVKAENSKTNCPKTENSRPESFVSLADAGYPEELIHLVYKDNGGDNVFDCPLYSPDQRALVLNQEMANALINANNFMRERYKMQIFVNDAYRPPKAQKIARDIARRRGISSEYVAEPGTGKHPKGRALDLVLVDMEGNKLNMGAKFDTFDSSVHYNKDNNYQKILRTVLQKFGFTPYDSEYWHFSWNS